LKEEDFHNKDTSKEIAITVTFRDLNPEAQNDFKHYFRQGKLIVSAVSIWNPSTSAAPVKQYGQRLVMKEFAEYFKADEEGKSADELKTIYAKLRGSIKDLPQVGTKIAMEKSLHSFEEAHPELCKLESSEAEFYGFTKGANLLRKYVQWVCIPAVKDVTTEQLEAKKNALALLLERTVRSRVSFAEPLSQLKQEMEKRYNAILKQNQTALDGLSESLKVRLQEWAHPDASVRLSWDQEAGRYVSVSEPMARVFAGERSFEGSLERFGHGLQRSFLISLLQELSESGGVEVPILILGCEEPELYQHPPQARHLSSVLQKLSNKDTQVIVSTHSPYFVSGWGFQDVRVFRLKPRKGEKIVCFVTFDRLADAISKARGEPFQKPADIAIKVEQSLQPELNEMFFSSTVVFVEGLEDLAYIGAYFVLTKKNDEFRRFGCHIVPTGGKSEMIRPVAIAKQLGIPSVVIFDADGNEKREQQRAQHELDNRTLLNLCGLREADAFPNQVFMTDNVVVWNLKIGDLVKSELGMENWSKAEGAVRKKRSISVGNLEKNYLFIGFVLAELWDSGIRSKTLEGVCDLILKYAYASQDMDSQVSKKLAETSGKISAQ